MREMAPRRAVDKGYCAVREQSLERQGLDEEKAREGLGQRVMRCWGAKPGRRWSQEGSWTKA